MSQTEESKSSSRTVDAYNTYNKAQRTQIQLEPFDVLHANIVGTDIEHWNDKHVHYWLDSIGFEHYYGVFDGIGWNNGTDLLNLKEAVLLRESQIYFCNVSKMSLQQIRQDIRNIMREIITLQINENVDEDTSKISGEDVSEFKRKFIAFRKKWKRIAWVEEYVEDWGGRLPTTDVIEEGLNVPQHVAEELLSTYNQKQKTQNHDLNTLFEGFDIAEHGVMLWFIVFDSLQTHSYYASWSALCLITKQLPTSVSIEMLERFKSELKQFEVREIDRVCRTVIFSSLFPICSSLRLSHYMSQNALNDLSRQDEFNKFANNYIKLATRFLDTYAKSEHMVAILLEVASDIDGLSAVELAVKYQIIDFLADKRIGRIATALFREWRFLHPSNVESFNVTMNINTLFNDLSHNKGFYFTPLGQFTTECVSFVIFLFLYSYIATTGWTVYSTMTSLEYIFWTMNVAYVVFEIWDMYSSPNGITGYLSNWTNKFDIALALNFLTMMVLRIVSYVIYPQCYGNTIPTNAFDDDNTVCNDYSVVINNVNILICTGECNNKYCCKDSNINLAFFVLWMLSIITLWSRILHLFIMHKKVGPFVNMIANMVTDLWAFVQIFILFWLGTIFALMVVSNGDIEQYMSGYNTFLTTFKAALGEYPSGDIDSNVSEIRMLIINSIIIYWMVVAAIVLLNLLIALMSKSFDNIYDKNNQQVQFAVVMRSYALDNQIAVLQPPFSILVFFTMFIVKVIDYLSITCCKSLFPMTFLMPSWLIKEMGLRSIPDDDKEFTKKRGLKQKEERQANDWKWVCKYCKQETFLDYSQVSKRENTKPSSYILDPTRRLGDKLGLTAAEIVDVRCLQPKLCQNCYRRRKPITRSCMQLELISYWYFVFVLKYPLLFMVYMTKIFANFFMVHSDAKTKKIEQMKCPYSIDLLLASNAMKKFFTDENIIWSLNESSKYVITPRLLRPIVEKSILKKTSDRDFDLFKFYTIICGKNNLLRHKNGEAEWKKHEYAAKLWFKVILNNTRDSIHLFQTRLFPYSAKLIETHIKSSLTEDDNEFDFESFNEKHLSDFLGLLYITDQKEQEIVVADVRVFGNSNPEFTSKYGRNASLWNRFLFFLYEARKLITNVRYIQNMIRDCEAAAKTHGNDAEVYVSHFHLVFDHENLQNDAIATVIFRSIDQENKSIPYWKVRYFLIAVRQMRQNVDRQLLQKSRYTQVTRAEFLDVVLKLSINRAKDDDADDGMRYDTELAKKKIQGIRNEADKIFTRIWVQNELKISLTQFREYNRGICKDLRDTDSLSFIKQRLERYITKNNNESNSKSFSEKNIAPLSIELFKNIMVVDKSEFLKYNKEVIGGGLQKYRLYDEDDVPKIYDIYAIYQELCK
eukprot:420016_1